MRRDTHNAPLPKVGDRVQEYTWRESGEVRAIVDGDVYVVRHWVRPKKYWAYTTFYAYQWTEEWLQSWGPKGWNKQRIEMLKRWGRYFG